MPDAGRRLGANNKHNRQIEYIIEQLKPSMDKLLLTTDDNKRMAELAYETYVMVEEMIFQIVDRKWMSKDSKLVLLGGIMINIDGDAADMFIPLNFEAMAGDGSVTNLLEKVFGKAAGELADSKVPKKKCKKGQNENDLINKCIPCGLLEECSYATQAQKDTFSKNFPSAMPSRDIENRVFNTLKA